jgi:hypothetical protein
MSSLSPRLRDRFDLKYPLPHGVKWVEEYGVFTYIEGVYHTEAMEHQARWEGFLLGVRGYV